MGISGLLPFVKNACRPVHMKEFSGRTAAVDVYCFLHKGAFGCAELIAQGKPTDAYVKYVMKFVNLLLYYDIKPILVFDGRNLPSKSETEKKRRESRRANKEKATQLLSEGRSGEAREYFQRCVDITPAMAREVIQVCQERNVDCIIAPYEADAQLAFLSRTIVDLVITEDSDLTLFGCDNIIFKLNDSGHGTLYEKRKLNEVFGNLAMQFDFEKFKNMCIMAGCDYLTHLPGIGLGKSKLFWSKISNPDIRTVLPKIPHYLKLPTVSVTQQYIQGFIQAQNTFRYQVVFDPITRKERPLTDYGPEVDTSELTYCGDFQEPSQALQLALGNLDLHTLLPKANFDPDNQQIHHKNSKFGKLAGHTSMWTKGYKKEDSHKKVMSLKPPPSAASNSKFKQVVVRTSFKKPDPLSQTSKSSLLQKPLSSEKRKPLFADNSGLKRKHSTFNPEEVEQILTSDHPPPAKKTKLPKREEEEEEEELEPRHKYSRTLGDTKMEVKGSSSTTISRYFGAENLTKEEADQIILDRTRRSATKPEDAGSWFDSIARSASLQGEYVYRPEAAHSPEMIKPSDRAVNSERGEAALTDISNSPPNKKSLQTFQRKPSRNPFAVKKPIFKDSSSQKPEEAEQEREAAGDGVSANEPASADDGTEDPDTGDDDPKLVIDLGENDKTDDDDSHRNSRLSSPLKSLLERSKRQVPTPALGALKFPVSGSEVVGSSAKQFDGGPRLAADTHESKVKPFSAGPRPMGPFNGAPRPVGPFSAGPRPLGPFNGAPQGSTSGRPSRPTISSLKPGVRSSGLFKKAKKPEAASGGLKQSTLTAMFTKITKKAEI